MYCSVDAGTTASSSRANLMSVALVDSLVRCLLERIATRHVHSTTGGKYRRDNVSILPCASILQWHQLPRTQTYVENNSNFSSGFVGCGSKAGGGTSSQDTLYTVGSSAFIAAIEIAILTFAICFQVDYIAATIRFRLFVDHWISDEYGCVGK